MLCLVSQIAKCAEEVEHDLELVGVSAIEDKLQARCRALSQPRLVAAAFCLLCVLTPCPAEECGLRARFCLSLHRGLKQLCPLGRMPKGARTFVRVKDIWPTWFSPQGGVPAAIQSLLSAGIKVKSLPHPTAEGSIVQCSALLLYVT